MTAAPPTTLINLPFDQWPAADQQFWLALLSPGDKWGSLAGPAASWRPGTVELRRQSYATWLSFLQRILPEKLCLAPTARVTPQVVDIYLQELKCRLKNKSISSLLSGLASVMRAAAMDQDWDWLWNASRFYDNKANLEAPKPLPPITAKQIFKAALDALTTLQTVELTTLNPTQILRHASTQRNALTFAFLISNPVRLRSLLSMTAESLTLENGRFIARFTADQMKNKRASQAPLPAVLTTHFTDYLHLHRPALLAGRQSSGPVDLRAWQPHPSTQLQQSLLKRHSGDPRA